MEARPGVLPGLLKFLETSEMKKSVTGGELEVPYEIEVRLTLMRYPLFRKAWDFDLASIHQQLHLKLYKYGWEALKPRGRCDGLIGESWTTGVTFDKRCLIVLHEAIASGEYTMDCKEGLLLISPPLKRAG